MNEKDLREKVEKANENIAELIEILVHEEREFLFSGYCPPIENSEDFKNYECGVECSKCKKDYLKKYRNVLLEKYSV